VISITQFYRCSTVRIATPIFQSTIVTPHIQCMSAMLSTTQSWYHGSVYIVTPGFHSAHLNPSVWHCSARVWTCQVPLVLLCLNWCFSISFVTWYSPSSTLCSWRLLIFCISHFSIIIGTFQSILPPFHLSWHFSFSQSTPHLIIPLSGHLVSIFTRIYHIVIWTPLWILPS
jgi:hypothetical protein